MTMSIIKSFILLSFHVNLNFFILESVKFVMDKKLWNFLSEPSPYLYDRKINNLGPTTQLCTK